MSAWQKLLALFASSRPIQATLSVSQPVLVAFFVWGPTPDLRILFYLVIGAVTGLFAVFSLNDFLDVELDKVRMRNVKVRDGRDIDTFLMRHPYAQGKITRMEAGLWIVILGSIAGTITYMLSPIAFLLFLISAGLEVLYCKLAKRTELKFLVTGLMIGFGVLIGWYATGADTEMR